MTIRALRVEEELELGFFESGVQKRAKTSPPTGGSNFFILPLTSVGVKHIMAGAKKSGTLSKKPTSLSKKMEDITEASAHPSNVEAPRRLRYARSLDFMPPFRPCLVSCIPLPALYW